MGNIGYKMTEDEVVSHLQRHFEDKGWNVKCCKESERGIDIDASKGDKRVIMEAKGAMAGEMYKKRKHFDGGQITTHFGKAIVKILKAKIEDKNAEFAIAHPDDALIKKHIGNLIPFLKDLEIPHYWVSQTGEVTKS